MTFSSSAVTHDREDGLRASSILVVYLVVGPSAGAICLSVATLLWGVLTLGPFAIRWQQGLEITIFAALISYVYAGIYAMISGLLVMSWYIFRGNIHLYISILAPLAAVYPASMVRLTYKVETSWTYDIGLPELSDIGFLAAIGVAASLVCWAFIRVRIWRMVWSTRV